jgi:hypothetical protein
MESADGTPDPALLAQALANNWSNTQWDLTLKQKDAKYKETEGYKADQSVKLRKGESFDLHWKRLFGENATPDPSLREKFMGGTDDDLNSLWDDIKKTGEFQSQYAQWDAFAAAQNAQGQNVMEDPGLYKQYQKAFTDAFSNQGMQAPQGLDRLFFASGIDTSSFSQNLGQYVQQQQSYQWQTGQEADVATASGVGDKTAGGDLRKRMAEALGQHQAYAKSKFTDFRTQEENGRIASKI